MPKISVLLCTARGSHPIIGQPDRHVLEPTLTSLEKQSFKDFELVIIDSLYPEKRDWIDSHSWSYPVKYRPVMEGHDFWLRRKRWNVAGALNSAIIHSDGHLLTRVDDCSEFDRDYLNRVWKAYGEGYFLLGMHKRYRYGEPAKVDENYLEEGYEAKYSKTLEPKSRKALLMRMYGRNGLVRDTRFPYVEAHGGRMTAYENWYYGYSTMSMEAALKINGYDERFDGQKSQEDQDAGLRLQMAGYRNMFLLDVNHTVIEHEHLPIPEEVVARDQKPIVCNYALYQLNKSKRWHRANSHKLSEEDLEYIRNETLQPPCSPHPDFYHGGCRGELWEEWVNHANSNLFDIREERLYI